MSDLDLQPATERKFDPSRFPLSDELWELVRQVSGALTQVEARKRKRRARDQGIFDQSVTALVSDLAHLCLYRPGCWIAVDLSNRVLSPRRRPAPYMTENFRAVVRLMETAGLVELQLGFRNAFQGRKTTIRPTPKLEGLVGELQVSWEDFGRRPDLLGPSVELRGPKYPTLQNGKHIMKAKVLSLPDTAEVSAMRAEMDRINGWIAQADLSWGGDPVAARVDLSQRHLRRIFNDGRFDCGGRLYGGFWQSCKRADRLHDLWISGEPVAELDYCQSAVRQAYAQVGAEPPPGDLYMISGLGLYRAEVKAVLNALLSSDGHPTRFPQGTRGSIPKNWKFARVLSMIQRHHSAIAPLFGGGLGLRYMFQESQAMAKALLRLIDNNVVALPIYDCVLVPLSAVPLAKSVMEQAFMEAVGVPGVVDVEMS